MASNIEKGAEVETLTEYSGLIPDGKRLLAMLVELYAEQCGVEITYEIVDNHGELLKGNTKDRRSILSDAQKQRR